MASIQRIPPPWPAAESKTFITHGRQPLNVWFLRQCRAAGIDPQIPTEMAPSRTYCMRRAVPNPGPRVTDARAFNFVPLVNGKTMWGAVHPHRQQMGQQAGSGRRAIVGAAGNEGPGEHAKRLDSILGGFGTNPAQTKKGSDVETV